MQVRWWYDVDASRKKYDKPAVTGSQYVWIRMQVPVVMLQDVRGLGKKGQIVEVKRGFARHNLVPKGLAVFATWENIDMYADPHLVDDPTLKARVASERGRLPFDWVDEIKLSYVRWTREDDSGILVAPVTVWDILETLSNEHQLDCVPGNVTIPEDGFNQVGHHEIPLRIPVRNPDAAAGKYNVSLEIISQQSLLEEMRRLEMTKAVEGTMKFQLKTRGTAVAEAEYSEDDEDSEHDA